MDADTNEQENNAIELDSSSPLLRSNRSRLRWVPLIGQFGLAVLVCLLTAFWIELRSRVTASIFIGFLYVQILLASVWIALAPTDLVTRVISSTAATLFFCLCMYRVAWRDGNGHAIAISIVAPMLILWLLYQIPLWSLRFRGRKLAIPGKAIPDDRKEEFQFGIKHLLIWTTVIAVFLAIAKVVIAGINFEQDSGFAYGIEIGILMTLGNGLIAVPIIWGMLAKHYLWAWTLIAIVVCAVVSVAELWFSNSALAPDFLIILNLSQCFLAISAMLAVRLTGYRIHHVGP